MSTLDTPRPPAGATGIGPAAQPIPRTPGRVARAIPLSRRSVTAMAATSAVGVLAFGWPMLAPPGSQLLAHASDAPVVFGLLVPLLLAVALSVMADGAMGAKAVALLGVLAATAAALRAIGAGIAGLEPIWIVIVLGGYALGAGFGFVLGPVCLLASALLTGGVGPWLPFQMLGAAWVGLGAGLLAGRLPGRTEIPLLAAYSTMAAVAYGWLMNLWFWPTATGLPEALSFVPGAGAAVNLTHWFTFNLTTSMGYDVPRALLTCTAVVLLGRRVLDSLRRTSRLAAFDAAPQFPGGPVLGGPVLGGPVPGGPVPDAAVPPASVPPASVPAAPVSGVPDPAAPDRAVPDAPAAQRDRP